jgi:hypothetical protein
MHATLATIKREAGALAKSMSMLAVDDSSRQGGSPPSPGRSSEDSTSELLGAQRPPSALSFPPIEQDPTVDTAAIESALQNSLDLMNRLEALVLLCDAAAHKQTEKDAAVKLSVLIRYCKKHGESRSLADELFTKTQAMVAAGRVALGDKTKVAPRIMLPLRVWY